MGGTLVVVLVTPGVERLEPKLEPNSGATAAALGGGGFGGRVLGTGAATLPLGGWNRAAPLLLLVFEGEGTTAGGVASTPGLCRAPVGSKFRQLGTVQAQMQQGWMGLGHHGYSLLPDVGGPKKAHIDKLANAAIRGIQTGSTGGVGSVFGRPSSIAAFTHL